MVFKDMKIASIILLVMASNLHLVMASQSFPKLNNAKISSDHLLPINKDGDIIGLEDRQRICRQWVSDCLKKGDHASVSKLIKPKFEKTALGQTLLKDVLAKQENDKVLLPILCGLMAQLLSTDDPLILARSRYYIDTDTAKMKIIRKIGTIIGEEGTFKNAVKVSPEVIALLVGKLEASKKEAKSNETDVFAESIRILKSN